MWALERVSQNQSAIPPGALELCFQMILFEEEKKRQKMTHSLPFQTSAVPLEILVHLSPPLLKTCIESPSTGYSPVSSVSAVKWSREKCRKIYKMKK